MLKLKTIREGYVAAESPSDMFLCACGYEGRARAVAEALQSSSMSRAKRRIALGFTTQQDLEYSANKIWFQSHEFEVIEVTDDNFRATIDELLSNLVSDQHPVQIGIDVSCLNRFRLAHLVDSVRCLAVQTVNVVFHYSLANYTAPVKDAAPTVTVEPVIPQFAGWTTRPDKPPAAVVGLGYEPNKAIGVIDHLEINNATWAFYPVGPIAEYHESLWEANASLLQLIQTDGRCRPYEIAHPAKLFQEINSLVDMLRANFNIVLIPFGPKIFALVALLVGCVHDDVGIWRVSSGSLEEPVNRRPSGHFIGLSVTFA